MRRELRACPHILLTSSYTSQITVGGWREEHLEEQVSWSPVLDPELGHWLLQIKELRVDGEVLPFCNEGCKAVVDSGTSLLAVPTPIFPELYEMLRSPASLQGECSSRSPRLQIELEGFTVELDGEDPSAKFYTVYDAEKKRIGFGRAKHAPASFDESDQWWIAAERWALGVAVGAQ
eukprot:Skav213669  [mRNA]  locus=scaffold491:91401:95848:- [translate_table: standard]